MGRADILFIDVNNAASEVAAAQRAADARHEKLIVVPIRTKQMTKDEKENWEFLKNQLLILGLHKKTKITFIPN